MLGGVGPETNVPARGAQVLVVAIPHRMGILEVLVENDYLFDASTLPTFLGPLARAYYFRKSDLTEAEREKRRKLFGGFKADTAIGSSDDSYFAS